MDAGFWRYKIGLGENLKTDEKVQVYIFVCVLCFLDGHRLAVLSFHELN